MAEPRSVIVIVIDGLQPAFLGAYGNTWIATPGLDRLAAESFVCDTALADTQELAGVYRGFWHGQPALWPEDAAEWSEDTAERPASLIARASAAGWQTALITDDELVANLPAAHDFSQRTLLPKEDPAEAAAEIDETAAMRFLAEGSDWLQEAREPFLLWMHTRGLLAPWDAPYALRAQYADEEDPPPPRWLAPEWRELAEDVDPDELLGLTHAYAGQVSLWDACLAAWLDEFRAHPAAANTLLVFVSLRGYPLGEHRQVGRATPDLHNENVQIAWWWRFPDGLGAPARTPALVLPADLPATIANWLSWPVEPPCGGRSLMPLVRWQQSSVREAAVLTAGPDRWAIRTLAWQLLAKGGAGAEEFELYAKPADRFEVNDIARRAPEIVAGLSQQLQRARSAPNTELTDLDWSLVTIVD